MTDAVVHLSGAASRRGPVAAVLGRSLYRATIADDTRRALDELPDNLLRDIGVTRSDIPFAVGELGDRIVVVRGSPPRRRRHIALSLALVAAAAVLTLIITSRANLAQDSGPFGLSKTPASFAMKIVAPRAATIGHSAPK